MNDFKLINIPVKRISQRMFDPIATNYGKSSWFDLRVKSNHELKAGEFKLLALNLAMNIPMGYEAIVIPRSSTYKKFGIIMANGIGLIDNSFCGDTDEWMFPAIAFRDTKIEAGKRIAQFRLIHEQDANTSFEYVSCLDQDDRGGFGSTGED